MIKIIKFIVKWVEKIDKATQKLMAIYGIYIAIKLFVTRFHKKKEKLAKNSINDTFDPSFDGSFVLKVSGSSEKIPKPILDQYKDLVDKFYEYDLDDRENRLASAYRCAMCVKKYARIEYVDNQTVLWGKAFPTLPELRSIIEATTQEEKNEIYRRICASARKAQKGVCQ